MNHQEIFYSLKEPYTELNNKDFSLPARHKKKKKCFCSNMFYVQYKVKNNFKQKKIKKKTSKRPYSEPNNKNLYLH